MALERDRKNNPLDAYTKITGGLIMTREEEIRLAGIRICFPSESTIAFKKGAEWADNNPKNPWISVEDDLPFNHKELLDSSKRMTFQVFIRYDDDRHGFSCMAKILDEWKWLNNWNKITHWMKVPEIPKEE